MIALAAIVLVAAVYFLQQGGEKEVSRDEFKELLNATPKAAVIQDLRAGDAAARLEIQNCGVQLSFTLSSLGKNVTNYAFDGSECFGGAAPGARPIADCLSEIRSESRLSFSIALNTTANRTAFSRSGASYYGDGQFLSDCAITGLVR
ncbi:Uncharacterised protein [uncultured archaeon]|nr:Uncharacterised protein [uncultured archaeon]